MLVGWNEHRPINRVSSNSLDRSRRSSYNRAGWIDDREGRTKVGAPVRSPEATGSTGESKLAVGASSKAMVTGGAEIKVVDLVQGVSIRSRQLEATMGTRSSRLYRLM